MEIGAILEIRVILNVVLIDKIDRGGLKNKTVW
jgi:hypothetical protein